MNDFEPFPKIPRLTREIVVTEKIDGTNAQVFVGDDGEVRAGSRNRWITPADDNFGFARWVLENEDALRGLGAGRHFGEWWGAGIQRRYGQSSKRFSLFNVDRWDGADRPECCDIVPTLYRGPFDTREVDRCIEELRENGSRAAPGFMRPEGVIVFHIAARTGFKKTLERDDAPKSAAT